MVRRHGYYLARSETTHGDPDLASSARELWNVARARIVGIGEDGPGLYDGASIWTLEDGTTLRRIVVVRPSENGLVQIVEDLGVELAR
jgi:hypothetical protein